MIPVSSNQDSRVVYDRDMINIPEILVADGTGIFLMLFLLDARRKNKDNNIVGERLFDAMAWIVSVGCAVELLSFVLDGVSFAGANAILFAMNSFLFLGTNTVGCLWCYYVDFRIYHSYRRLRRRKWLAIPLALLIASLLFNCFAPGWIFSISDHGVYHRGRFIVLVYVYLFIYYGISVVILAVSKKRGVQVKFFPVAYFIVPCIIGTLVQWLFYGIAMGWMSVAVALLLIYILLQNENTYVDSLTGLYNHKYMDYILKVVNAKAEHSYFGIMMDMDHFKSINDRYGHLTGDDAIRNMGRIISKNVVDNSIAIRYAGDEFVILMETEDQAEADALMADILKSVDNFNESGGRPYKLSVSMGLSILEKGDCDTEGFFKEMDMNMYHNKRKGVVHPM